MSPDLLNTSATLQPLIPDVVDLGQACSSNLKENRLQNERAFYPDDHTIAQEYKDPRLIVRNANHGVEGNVEFSLPKTLTFEDNWVIPTFNTALTQPGSGKAVAFTGLDQNHLYQDSMEGKYKLKAPQQNVTVNSHNEWQWQSSCE